MGCLTGFQHQFIIDRYKKNTVDLSKNTGTVNVLKVRTLKNNYFFRCS